MPPEDPTRRNPTLSDLGRRGPTGRGLTRRGLTRRELLGGSAALGSIGVGLGVYRALWYSGDDTYAGLGTFSPTAGFILGTLIDTMLPSMPRRTQAEQLDQVRAIDAYCRGMGPEDRRELVLLIFALEHATPLAGHMRRFSALDAASRTEVLADWQISTIAARRLGFRALKSLAFLAYYRTPTAWRFTGYTGPMLPGGLPEAQARYDSLLAPSGALPGWR